MTSVTQSIYDTHRATNIKPFIVHCNAIFITDDFKMSNPFLLRYQEQTRTFYVFTTCTKSITLSTFGNIARSLSDIKLRNMAFILLPNVAYCILGYFQVIHIDGLEQFKLIFTVFKLEVIKNFCYHDEGYNGRIDYVTLSHK